MKYITHTRIFLSMLLLVFFFTTAAYAQFWNDKVVVYNFKDKSATTSYSYYSYIIPDSIAVELRKKKDVSIRTYPVTIDFVDTKTGSAEEKRSHILYLSQKGKELSADFVVSGTYSVDNRRIHIKSQIFDVKEQKIVQIDESSNDLGALLFLIIDKITGKINSELNRFQEEHRERYSASPFAALYNSMRGLTFGFKFGEQKIHGEWGDIYDDPDYLGFYISYDFANIASLESSPLWGNSGLSMQYDFFSTYPENRSSYLSARSVTLSYIFYYPLAEGFRIAFSAGGGMTRTKIIVTDPLIEGGDPFTPNLTEEVSYDPTTLLSIYADFRFNPVVINAGYAYRRIFYTDTPMNLSILFFGLGFCL
ncbi:MAG TPA: hypothetical protein PK200_04790 [Spirochaetota bacterium]|nr:hypothetical protein [Spirochaetota bacterium]